MKQTLKQEHALPLWLATVFAAVLFAALCWQRTATAGTTPDSRNLSAGAPLVENRDIYQSDNNLYDVYISVFPTADGKGNTLDFSSFQLHTSGDHSYNPILNCNIQILPEGQSPGPLRDLEQPNATIRVRGNSTRGAKYKNYKVRLGPKAPDFFGQTVLNINKDSQDISRVCTKLSTDLLAEMDNVVSYRSYFMRLWIRDASLPREEQDFEYQGMYIELEQPNKAYLRARDLGEDSTLYKARSFTFRLDDALRDTGDPEYSEAAFEEVLGIREGSGHKKLLEMLDAVNDESRDFQQVFAQYFNEDNYLTWLAFNLLIGNEDFVSQNYLLYNPETSDTWYFIHWDFDGSLRFGDYESQRPISLRGIQRLIPSLLHRRYFQIPGNLEKLDAKMQELLDTCITRERVSELLASYRPVLEKTYPLPPDVSKRRTPEMLFAYLDNLYDGILHNYDVFHISSQYPFSGFVANPKRNEDGSIWFAWDAFYSLKGQPITYNLRIYSDIKMQNLVYETTGLRETGFLLEEGLPNGTYYLQVTGTDSDGWEQLSLEYANALSGTEVVGKSGLREFTLK